MKFRNFLNVVYSGLFVSNLMQLFVVLCSDYVDTILAGNFIGEEAVSAIAVVLPLYTFALFLGNLISNGCASLYSNYIGSLQPEKAYKTIGQGLLVNIFIGILYSLILFLIKDPFIQMQNLTPEVASLASDYYTWYIGIVFLTPINSLLSNIVYNNGDVRQFVMSEVIGLIGKIVLAIIFARGLNMGISGLSLSTLCATSLTICILVLHFFKKSVKTKFKLAFSFASLKESITIGAPTSVVELGNSIFTFIINAYIIANFGDIYLNVFTVVTLVIDLCAIFFATGNACAPLLSVYNGEKNQLAMRNTVILASKYAVVTGIFLTLLLIVFSGYLPLIFGINTPELYDTCVTAVNYTAISVTFIIIASFVLQVHSVTGHPGLALCESIFLYFISRLIFSILCMQLFGIEFIGLGYLFGSLFTIILFSIFMLIKYKKTSYPFVLPVFKDKLYIFNFCKKNQPEEVGKKIEECFQKNNIDKSVALKARFIVEGHCRALLRYNEKYILSELSVKFSDDAVELIFRDNGKIIDIDADTREQIKLSSYSLYCAVNTFADARNMITSNHNRFQYKISR